jgi:hypothetical protein
MISELPMGEYTPMNFVELLDPHGKFVNTRIFLPVNVLFATPFEQGQATLVEIKPLN